MESIFKTPSSAVLGVSGVSVAGGGGATGAVGGHFPAGAAFGTTPTSGALSSPSSAPPAPGGAGGNTTGVGVPMVHYVLLRTDTATPLITSSNWNDLDLNQTDTQYIFAKLQLAARQLAATLQSTPSSLGVKTKSVGNIAEEMALAAPYAQAIHMRGQKHIFSYYSLGEYSLICHREEWSSLSASGGLAELDSAETALSNSPDMICNDGSLDFEKEAALKIVLQQLYVLLNTTESTGPNSSVLGAAQAQGFDLPALGTS